MDSLIVELMLYTFFLEHFFPNVKKKIYISPVRYKTNVFIFYLFFK